MPSEKFYLSGQGEGDGRSPDITIAWGQTPEPAVLINNNPVDRSALNRMINTLRRARDQVYGADA